MATQNKSNPNQTNQIKTTQSKTIKQSKTNEIKPKQFNQERVRGSDFSSNYSNKLINNYLEGKINKKWLKPIVRDRKKI